MELDDAFRKHLVQNAEWNRDWRFALSLGK
jgi:hypothetical protein